MKSNKQTDIKALKKPTKITPEMEEQFAKDVEEAIAAPKKDVKVRITTMIDADILEALKLQSSELGVKYQTYLNDILRERVLGEIKGINMDVVQAVLDERMKKREEQFMQALDKRYEAKKA